MGFPFSPSRMSRFIDCISKIMKLNVFLITGAVLGGASAVVDHDLPVRVFLLVGQSELMTNKWRFSNRVSHVHLVRLISLFY